MTSVRSLRPAAALALLLLCSCASAGKAGNPPPPPEGPGRLVLQVEHVGGFVTPEMLASRLPLASVYADGRVITQGPQIAIYPGPALPNLQVWQLDPASAETVVDRAVAAGVTGTGDLGSPPIADAPSTRFTLVTDSGTWVREVYALFEVPGGTGLTPEQRATRGELRGLLDVLTAPEGPPGATGSRPESYRPDAVAAVVRPWTPAAEEGLAQPEIAWPGPALPGEPLTEHLDLTCVTARGAEAAAVLDITARANELTPWVAADGTRWTLTLRPLLPHETGCADLAGS